MEYRDFFTESFTDSYSYSAIFKTESINYGEGYWKNGWKKV